MDPTLVTGSNLHVRVHNQGDTYWRLDKHVSATEGQAWVDRPIRDGFPGAPDNLDAAFVWSGNVRIYFIKGLRHALLTL